MTSTDRGASMRRAARATGLVLAVTLSSAVTGVFVGGAARQVAGNRMAPWIIGRASGVCCYVLLVVLVLSGLLLSHPWRTRLTRPSNATRIRLHVSLAAGVLVFTVLHVVVLATDRYSGVGWMGALLPMHAQYRPVPTTLGLIGLWSGLLAGLTALLAGRLPRRFWWPIHKVAAAALVLVWMHGVLGGGDTPALFAMYVGSALLVVGVAVSRYAARTPADLVLDTSQETGAALHEVAR